MARPRLQAHQLAVTDHAGGEQGQRIAENLRAQSHEDAAEQDKAVQTMEPARTGMNKGRQ